LPEFGGINDLLRYGTYFVATSVMYRRSLDVNYDQFRRPGSPNILDFNIHLERASKGAIHLDRRVFGCYRIHPHGISRNPAFRQILEEGYEAAFDRALELGAAKALVESARMRQRMLFSINRYMAGDISGYQQKIRIGRENWSAASVKHLILHLTRFFPHLVGVYARLRGIHEPGNFSRGSGIFQTKQRKKIKCFPTPR
jgi:hypothetical protein